MEIKAEREVTVLQEGPVTVRKSALDLGQVGVSGVKLAISSSADDPVDLELHEGLPVDLALADIQAHPQYWPGKWRKDAANHRLVFEHEFSPGGSIETIYGVRLTPDQLGPLLGDPELKRVEVAGETALVEPDAAVRSEDATGRPAESEPNKQSAKDRTATPEPAAETGATDESGAPPERDASPEADEAQTGGVQPAQPEAADAGADRFRYGEDRPSSDGPTVENSSPGPPRAAGDDGTGMLAQLEALQTAVDELTTSVETLGRRFEETGEPSAAIEALQSRQAEHEETLAELAEQLRRESERRAELAGRLRDEAAERAALQDQIQAADEHRDELSVRLRTEEDHRAALAERVTNYEDQLLELRDRYEYRLESLVDRVDELESTFSSEESRAIREVIAAERRWKRQQERRNRPARLPSTSQGR